jgi:sugar/nucleoside kinase (ribokinase family)
MVELDYLVVGHVTRDLKKDGAFTVGGTVSYAARTARALGCRVGVITSASPDLDLSQVLNGVLLARIPASTTTTFENVYTAGGRRQILHTVAETLSPAMAPPDWRAAVVHLGPVAQECDPALVNAFGNAFIGVTPQGWMRCWDRDGRVNRCRWEEAGKVLARADAVVLSEEDVASDKALISEYAAQAWLVAVTQGAAGCTVYTEGQAHHFPAPIVQEIDPTGAGDVFAAAFFTWLQRGRDPQTAARFANCVAARSVTRAGLSGTPNPKESVRCERASRG